MAKGHGHGFLEAHQSTVARIASQRPPGFWADAAIGSFGIYEGARRMERKLTETATDLGSHRKRNEGGDGHGNEAHRHGHGRLGCRSGAQAGGRATKTTTATDGTDATRHGQEPTISSTAAADGSCRRGHGFSDAHPKKAAMAAEGQTITNSSAMGSGLGFASTIKPGKLRNGRENIGRTRRAAP